MSWKTKELVEYDLINKVQFGKVLTIMFSCSIVIRQTAVFVQGGYLPRTDL